MAKEKRETVSIVGVFEKITYRSKKEDDDFCFAYLEDGTTIAGQIPEGSLQPGVPYQFHGYWHDHPQHGKRFNFDMFVSKEPHSRLGVITYLEKYAPGIGPIRAGQLHDQYGGDAVKILRQMPDVVAKQMNWSPELCVAAAVQLTKLSKFEDTKIQLGSLLKGKGFGGKAIDACIEKWGVLAPARIQRDPFCMLVERIPGAGFERCNTLYLTLGLKPNRLKRQLICLWHALREERQGNTWSPADIAALEINKKITKVPLQPNKAIRLGVRARWLSTHVDGEGKRWIAEYQKAADEHFLAQKIAELIGWDGTRRDYSTTTEDVGRFQPNSTTKESTTSLGDEFADL